MEKVIKEIIKMQDEINQLKQENILLKNKVSNDKVDSYDVKLHKYAVEYLIDKCFYTYHSVGDKTYEKYFNECLRNGRDIPDDISLNDVKELTYESFKRVYEKNKKEEKDE